MKKSGRIETSRLKDMGGAVKVQRHQLSSAEQQAIQMKNAVNALSAVNDHNLDELDALLADAESLCADNFIQTDELTDEEYLYGAELAGLDKVSPINAEPLITLTDIVNFDESESWESYMRNVGDYARANSIDLTADPFITSMSESQLTAINERVRGEYYERRPNCDKYDYLISAFCGAAAGLIDSFFVQAPIKGVQQGALAVWTDEQSKKLTQNVTEIVWSNDSREGKPKKCPDNIVSSVSYLERRFGVNYDARYASDLIGGEGNINLSPLNHHIKSLGHSPDIIGLIFSILDQFTGKASFVDGGKLIRLVPVKTPGTFILEGSNLVSKVFCGFSNWLGHLLSDLNGSGSTIKKGGRGTGLGMPFYELFGLCDFGNFKGNTVAELSVEAFENGYDLRFAAAQSIPVAINELIIRLMYLLKYHFYNGVPVKELLTLKSPPELNRMLLAGHGALCLVDTADAAARSGGNLLNFVLHLNAAGWARFSFACLSEIKSIYNRNHINVDKLDAELEKEWRIMFAGLN